jgi:predicted nucleotidyltransferase
MDVRYTDEGPAMTRLDDVLGYLRQNRVQLRSRFHVTRIGVFGSMARGDSTEQSDIDLIVELDENSDDIHRLKDELREFVGKPFGRRVDIAREKYLRPYARRQILAETVYVE